MASVGGSAVRWYPVLGTTRCWAPRRNPTFASLRPLLGLGVGWVCGLAPHVGARCPQDPARSGPARSGSRRPRWPEALGDRPVSPAVRGAREPPREPHVRVLHLVFQWRRCHLRPQKPPAAVPGSAEQDLGCEPADRDRRAPERLDRQARGQVPGPRSVPRCPPRPGLGPEGRARCGCRGGWTAGPWRLRTHRRPAALGLGVSAGLTLRPWF